MAARLRSISRRIHWSLLLKAAIFAAAWLFLPFWMFVLAALYLYYVPWFKPGKLALPFFALLLLAYLQPVSPLAAGLWFALIFGAIFYCTMLVKDLLVLDRRSLYEIIILALSFFLLRDFYGRFAEGIGGAAGAAGAAGGGSIALFYAFLVAAAIALLVRSFLGAFPEEAAAGAPNGAHVADSRRFADDHGRRLRRTVAWLSFLLIAQVAIVGLFLPLDFTYQSAIVFLVSVLIIDLAAGHVFAGDGGLSRNNILGVTSTVFAFLVIVLASARWGL